MNKVHAEQNIEKKGQIVHLFMLRLPKKIAASVHEALQTGESLWNRMTIQLNKKKCIGKIQFDGKIMLGHMVDLPTISEIYKTKNNLYFHKIADVSQMMVCKKKSKKNNACMFLRRRRFPHGLAPPFQYIRARRFRPVKKNIQLTAEEVEYKLRRLLREDIRALRTEYKVTYVEKDDEDENIVSTDDDDVSIKQKQTIRLVNNDFSSIAKNIFSTKYHAANMNNRICQSSSAKLQLEKSAKVYSRNLSSSTDNSSQGGSTDTDTGLAYPTVHVNDNKTKLYDCTVQVKQPKQKSPKIPRQPKLANAPRPMNRGRGTNDTIQIYAPDFTPINDENIGRSNSFFDIKSKTLQTTIASEPPIKLKFKTNPTALGDITEHFIFSPDVVNRKQISVMPPLSAYNGGNRAQAERENTTYFKNNVPEFSALDILSAEHASRAKKIFSSAVKCAPSFENGCKTIRKCENDILQAHINVGKMQQSIFGEVLSSSSASSSDGESNQALVAQKLASIVKYAATTSHNISKKTDIKQHAENDKSIKYPMSDSIAFKIKTATNVKIPSSSESNRKAKIKDSSESTEFKAKRSHILTKLSELRKESIEAKAEKEEKLKFISNLQNPTLKKRMEGLLNALTVRIAETDEEIRRQENLLQNLASNTNPNL